MNQERIKVSLDFKPSTIELNVSAFPATSSFILWSFQILTFSPKSITILHFKLKSFCELILPKQLFKFVFFYTFNT